MTQRSKSNKNAMFKPRKVVDFEAMLHAKYTRYIHQPVIDFVGDTPSDRKLPKNPTRISLSVDALQDLNCITSGRILAL